MENPIMQNVKKGTLFIVDISGYSHFIRTINAADGMKIIGQLFKAIIAENRISFSISEIEGDAILFYRFGMPPSIKEVLDEFTRMLDRFRNHIDIYSVQFPSVVGLGLKAVVHYGNMEEFVVDRFNKLYGNILVDAHRLLKNSVPSQTYLLATRDYLDELADFPLDYITSCGVYQCDVYDIGSLCYTYFPFGETKPPHSPTDFNVAGKTVVRSRFEFVP